MAVGCSAGAAVGLGSVVAIGAAVATCSGVATGVTLKCGGGVLEGTSVAFWPADVDVAGVGATVSAGAGGAAVGGGAPQADTSPNIAGNTMIEIARSKIALSIALSTESSPPARQVMSNARQYDTRHRLDRAR